MSTEQQAADPGPLAVSEFEWLSLEHALLNGVDHPLDELLENRNFIVGGPLGGER